MPLFTKSTLMAFLFFTSLPVNAEVRNEVDVFKNVEVCELYLDFLSVREGDFDSDECHFIARFLIENDGQSHSDFLRGYRTIANSGSGLSYTINSLLSLNSDSLFNAFGFLELADRETYHTFTKIGDVERALVYSSLFSRTKFDLLKSICKSSDCAEEVPVVTLHEVIGDVGAKYDESSAGSVVLCLARTDSFNLPIRKIFESSRFDICMLPYR